MVQPIRCEIVWKFVSTPPSQRWLTYGMPQDSATSLMESRACLGPDEQDRAAAAGDALGEPLRVLVGALFFIAGMRMIWVAGLAGAAAAGLFGAYLLVPHVAGRIKRFMNPASGDTFQVDMAMEAFWNGGWFGLGPGEGIAKRSLPDSHTDFVFAVAAEEFGIILCLALVALFAFVVIRTLTRAYASEDMFARFAASGLAILFGVQAAINMAVNLQLIPAKGMTLPFISYGGSSIISLAYGVGMMLALTRQRPRTEVESMNAAGAARGYA